MPRITFIEADGRSATHDIPEGWSVMQGATAHGVEGIVAECGGTCTCGTCHCYVDDARLGDLPPPSADEMAMLDMVSAERRPSSRLACQIKVTPALDGLVVHLPPTQY